MSAAARASRKWIVLGATTAIGAAGYLLYYGPGERAKFEATKEPNVANIQAAPDALDPNGFRPLKLSKIDHYNHNTNIFRFSFDDPKAKYNGKTASCVVLRAMINGKEVIRPYTPISRPNTVGHLEFIIKNYPNGTMSKHVHQLKQGDTIEIKGPIPKYSYQPNKIERLGLIAGGTGIAPMVQMIEEVLSNPDDKTKVTLLFANISVDDILLKKELDTLAQKNPSRFQVHYAVDKVTDKEKSSWKGEVGYLTSDVLKKYLPIPSKPDDENVLVMVCGPPGFMKLLSGEKNKDFTQGPLTGLLKSLGFSEKNVYKF